MAHHLNKTIEHIQFLDYNYLLHKPHVRIQLFLLPFLHILHDQSKSYLIHNHDHERKRLLPLFHIIHGMLLMHLPFQKNYGINLYFPPYILNLELHQQYELTLEIQMCFQTHHLYIEFIHINFLCNSLNPNVNEHNH